jgi:aminoglycoside phosphotransferase (APT) family kinase protein
MTDPAAVLAALDLPAATATQRQTGYDASVWRADLVDGRTVAVRLLRPGRHADGEVASLRLAADYGHPAPRVIATGRVCDREAIVMTWCAGRTMGDLLTDGGDTDELGRLFGRTHAVLHRRLDDGTVMCHLDYQPFNVLVDDGEVTGIVDWANAHAGDRREDLAWTTVVLEFAPSLLPEVAPGLAQFVAAWRDGYATDLSFPDDAEMAPFLAAAAQRQHANWSQRVDDGECPPQIAAATAALVARWT